jgi:hypothetical protein
MIHLYGVACWQEENGQKEKESFKPKIDALRKNFDMASITSENFKITHYFIYIVILPH